MKENLVKRFLFACLGNILIGAGIGFFNVSSMGADCYSAFALALGNRMGMTFATMLFSLNVICFVVEFAFGRKYIGLGTFINLLFVGTIATAVGNFLSNTFPVGGSMAGMLAAMAGGVLFLSLGISLYQQSDMGVAPYDALALILNEKLPFQYFWCRIILDGACAVGAFLLGGLIGLGTVVCAFGLGPIVQFFDNTVSKKIMKRQA